MVGFVIVEDDLDASTTKDDLKQVERNTLESLSQWSNEIVNLISFSLSSSSSSLLTLLTWFLHLPFWMSTRMIRQQFELNDMKVGVEDAAMLANMAKLFSIPLKKKGMSMRTNSWVETLPSSMSSSSS